MTRQAPPTIRRFDDDLGTNNLFLIEAQAGWRFLAREIIIDRYSGHVAEVRFYDPAGILAVRSQLSDYKPVTYADGVPQPPTIPQFPHKVIVSSPSQFLTVSLQFDDVKVWADFKAPVFLTPAFEGLKVIPTE